MFTKRLAHFVAGFLAFAQISLAQSLDIPVKGYGLSFGNSPHFAGIRFNFRDRGRVEVSGLNVTIWGPHEEISGYVKGIAIGLPFTGGGDIYGVATGLWAAGAERSMHGLMVGPLAAGAGESISGLLVGGLGAGSGKNISGIALAGLGLGSGKDLSGIMLAGLGLGAGRNLKGFAFAGLGAGSGRNVEGILIAGLGAGAGKNITGLSVALLGVGAGKTIKGITIAGLGAGAGEQLQGLSIAGAVGAPKVSGLAAGLAVGGRDFTGAALAPAYFRIIKNGLLKGVSVSAFNHIQGEQRGLSIGLFNFAEFLNGIQIGVLNYAKNNPKGLKLLPLFNAHFD